MLRRRGSGNAPARRLRPLLQHSGREGDDEGRRREEGSVPRRHRRPGRRHRGPLRGAGLPREGNRHATLQESAAGQSVFVNSES